MYLHFFLLNWTHFTAVRNQTSEPLGNGKYFVISIEDADFLLGWKVARVGDWSVLNPFSIFGCQGLIKYLKLLFKDLFSSYMQRYIFLTFLCVQPLESLTCAFPNKNFPLYFEIHS